MKYIVTKSYEDSSRYIANLFEKVISEKNDALLGLATGSSPEGLYKDLVDDYKAGKVDFSNVSTINLDEYIGLGRMHEQSFGYYMDQHLFSHVNIKNENIHLIDGQGNPEDEIRKYDEYLENHPIDILILGIGGNGHVGFNEPADSFIKGTHVVNLTEDTIKANSRFFNNISEVPKRSITMGMYGIVTAKKVVLIASGKAKANAISKLISSERIDPHLPCSILHLCSDSEVVVDETLDESIRQ